MSDESIEKHILTTLELPTGDLIDELIKARIRYSCLPTVDRYTVAVIPRITEELNKRTRQ